MADEFELAEREGRLGRGTAVRQAEAASGAVRLDPEDVELARRQAKSQGMEYQAYLKMVIHRAF